MFFSILISFAFIFQAIFSSIALELTTNLATVELIRDELMALVIEELFMDDLASELLLKLVELTID